MSPAARDIELLLIDGNNLLQRTRGGVDQALQRALFAQLREALPGVRKIVVFDGHRPPYAEPPQQLGRWLEVRYAGGVADDALVTIATGLRPAVRARTVLVTDDRGLTERVRSAGARTERLDWLVTLLDRRGRPASGIGRSRLVAAGPDQSDEDERVPWKPGRGATRKRGNPHRGRSERRQAPR